tara:strand:- start:643 stop:819 length:177 start_codon:yes stop_codon:yes gene_type:complete
MTPLDKLAIIRGTLNVLIKGSEDSDVGNALWGVEKLAGEIEEELEKAEMIKPELTLVE